jgi:acetoin utilization protein AcuB
VKKIGNSPKRRFLPLGGIYLFHSELAAGAEHDRSVVIHMLIFYKFLMNKGKQRGMENMIVEEIMNTNVETLKPEDTIESAIKLLRDKKIRHIPIVNNQSELIGIVSDRDVKDGTPSIFQKEKVDQELQNQLKLIMKTDVITGHPLDFVEEVAALFYEHNISCLPVIKEKKLVGIITETDLLHTLIQLTGAHQPGSQIEVKVPNKAGILYEVAGIIREHNANIHSVLVYPDKHDDSYKILVFRVKTMNPLGVVEHLKKEGYIVLWPNMPGVSS